MPKRNDRIFYPAMTAHITMRFDETLLLLPETSTPNRVSDGTTGSEGDTIAAAGPTAKANQVKTGQQTSAKSGSINASAMPIVYPGDQMTQVCNIIPLNGSVELLGFRQASKFNLEFMFRDLPIDPRTLRAASIELHLGTVAVEDFSEGMMGTVNAELQRASFLATRRESGLPNPDTLLFFGTIDEWSVEHADSGSRVTIEGRDLRGILLDAKLPGPLIAKINLNQGITVVVGEILAAYPAEAGLLIDIVGYFEDDVEPIVGDVDHVVDYRVSTTGAQQGGGTGSEEKTSYWDLITQYCQLVGCVPFFLGKQLWIVKTESLFDRIAKPRVPPFRSDGVQSLTREVTRPDGSTDVIRNVPRLVYGRDVNSLKFSRKFAGAAIVPTIEIIGTDDTQRGRNKRIIVTWPPEKSNAGKLKAGKDKLTIPYPGIRSKDRLIEIAKSIYEEVGRGEVSGEAMTSSLTSLGGDNADPDLVRLRPSDAIEIYTDPTGLSGNVPIVSELNQQAARPFEELVDFIAKRLGDRVIARVIAAASRGNVQKLLSQFRITKVNFNWQAGKLETTINFHNYILVRHSPDNATVKNNATAVTTKHRVSKPGENRQAKVTPKQAAAAAAFDHYQALVYQDGIIAHFRRLGLSDEAIQRAMANYSKSKVGK